MHWDFYTVSAVIGGIALILVAVAFGTVAGTGAQRFWLSFFGALSIGYGIYVAKQTSGFYIFPVQIILAPIALLALAVVRIIKCSTERSTAGNPPARSLGNTSNTAGALSVRPIQTGDPTSVTSPPLTGASPTLTLRAAQPLRVREAVVKQGASFDPRFAVLQATPENPLYRRSDLDLEWSLDNTSPTLHDGEQLLAQWFATSRLKVGLNKDLRPSGPSANVTWVTTFDGPGSVVLTDRRLAGIVRAGESVFGSIGQMADGGIVLWTLDIERAASVTGEQVGSTPAVVISTGTPRGLLYLSNLRSAAADGAAVVSPDDAAAQINACMNLH